MPWLACVLASICTPLAALMAWYCCVSASAGEISSAKLCVYFSFPPSQQRLQLRLYTCSDYSVCPIPAGADVLLVMNVVKPALVWCWADHLPLSAVRFKNVWSYTSTLYVFVSLCVTDNRNLRETKSGWQEECSFRWLLGEHVCTLKMAVEHWELLEKLIVSQLIKEITAFHWSQGSLPNEHQRFWSTWIYSTPYRPGVWILLSHLCLVLPSSSLPRRLLNTEARFTTHAALYSYKWTVESY